RTGRGGPARGAGTVGAPAVGGRGAARVLAAGDRRGRAGTAGVRLAGPAVPGGARPGGRRCGRPGGPDLHPRRGRGGRVLPGRLVGVPAGPGRGGGGRGRGGRADLVAPHSIVSSCGTTALKYSAAPGLE